MRGDTQKGAILWGGGGKKEALKKKNLLFSQNQIKGCSGRIEVQKKGRALRCGWVTRDEDRRPITKKKSCQKDNTKGGNMDGFALRSGGDKTRMMTSQDKRTARR